MTVELRKSEVLTHSPKPWRMLTVQEKRAVAARSLNARNDPESRYIGWLINQGNSMVNEFVIIDDL